MATPPLPQVQTSASLFHMAGLTVFRFTQQRFRSAMPALRIIIERIIPIKKYGFEAHGFSPVSNHYFKIKISPQRNPMGAIVQNGLLTLGVINRCFCNLLSRCKTACKPLYVVRETILTTLNYTTYCDLFLLCPSICRCTLL